MERHDEESAAPSSDNIDTEGTSDWSAWLSTSVSTLSSRRLRRFLHAATLQVQSAVKVTLSDEAWREWLAELGLPESMPGRQSDSTAQGRHLVRLFSANDYLGLCTHPDLRHAACRATEEAGMGVRSSPLVAGYSQAHAELERELAELKGTQDCLLFSSGPHPLPNRLLITINMPVSSTGFRATTSTTVMAAVTGFSANLSVIGALAKDSQVDVLSDELNHASIIDGARLSARGRVYKYRHNDLTHLESLLQELQRPGRRQMVVTDSLFSMDGDFAELQGLVALRERYGFLLALDEAHATLVCGHNGGGAAEAAGVSCQVDLHIGTLSKAIGSHGGFVACSSTMKAWLLNAGRSYVYSTALPAPVVAAATAAIRVAKRWRSNNRNPYHN